jgi:glutamate/aspartate transport system substrate-binding protein
MHRVPTKPARRPLLAEGLLLAACLLATCLLAAPAFAQTSGGEGLSPTLANI